MGRVKIQMKKIEDRQQRNIAFAKRKGGILKKAYEICILCDVPVALIFFSPSGKLFVFNAKERIEDIIDKYVAQPNYKRPSLQDEWYIKRWIGNMRDESRCSKSNLRENSLDDGMRYQIRPKGIEDEIDQCKVEIDNVDQKLEKYLKIPNQCESIDELKFREKELLMKLAEIRCQKQHLEDISKSDDDVSSWEFQTSMEISSIE